MISLGITARKLKVKDVYTLPPSLLEKDGGGESSSDNSDYNENDF